MPQINLSTLSGPELRQMLDSSRRQGDASLSYKVLQEMAARRAAAAPARNGRRKRSDDEPRALVVDLEPPQDDLPPMPLWRPPARPEDEPPLAMEAAAPAPAERRSWRKARGKPAKTSLAAAVAAHPDPALPTPARARSEAAPEAAPGGAPDPATGAQAHFRSLDLELADDGFEPLDAEPEALPRFQDTALNGVGSHPAADFEAPYEAAATVAAASHEDVDLRMGPAPPQAAPPPGRKPRRGGPRAPLGFALGLALGAALGWWVAVYRQTPEPAPAQTMATAAAAPPAAAVPPAAETAAPADSGTAAVEGALTPGATAAAAPPPAAVPPTSLPPAAPPATVAQASPPPEAAPPSSADIDEAAGAAPETPAARTGCAAAPSPADRVICGDPELKRLQKDLQKAYAQALAAHEDRSLLRERQLAWRDGRSTVTDPARLATLYRERIHKLEAATAEAKHRRGRAEAPH